MPCSACLEAAPWSDACVVFQPKDWTVKVNKKERRLAVATALQSAADDMMVISDIKVSSQSCGWMSRGGLSACKPWLHRKSPTTFIMTCTGLCAGAEDQHSPGSAGHLGDPYRESHTDDCG